RGVPLQAADKVLGRLTGWTFIVSVRNIFNRAPWPIRQRLHFWVRRQLLAAWLADDDRFHFLGGQISLSPPVPWPVPIQLKARFRHAGSRSQGRFQPSVPQDRLPLSCA